MMISDYRLEQNLPYDLTRPVAEMAAFFDILPQSDSTDVLKIVQEADGCVAILQTEDGTRRVSRPFTILQDVRGEWVRCAKLAVLDAFAGCGKAGRHLYRYSFLPYALFLLFFSIGNCAA